MPSAADNTVCADGQVIQQFLEVNRIVLGTSGTGQKAFAVGRTEDKDRTGPDFRKAPGNDADDSGMERFRLDDQCRGVRSILLPDHRLSGFLGLSCQIFAFLIHGVQFLRKRGTFFRAVQDKLHNPL